MNAMDGSIFLYINSDQVQHEIVGSRIADNILLDQVGLNHQIVATWFMLDCVLE